MKHLERSPGKQNIQTENEGNSYTPWLGASSKEDVKQTSAALDSNKPDWFIGDHYGLNDRWENSLRPHVGKIMIIDDLANRIHSCHLLLDQNFSPEKEKVYATLVPKSCLKLLGPKYALLSPEYAHYSESALPRTGETERVLVFMGGSDQADMTSMVLEALAAPEFEGLKVDVVVGANNKNKVRIAEKVDAHPSFRLHGPRPHLADLMARADLSVGAGGVTTWERLCLGLPSLVVSVAENQEPTCKALHDKGVINYVGFWKEVNKKVLAEKMKALLKNSALLKRQSLAGRTLVDGLGVKRVAEVLKPSIEKDLRLRPAQKKDMLLHYAWANDPIVRAHSLTRNAISLDTHIEWFEKKLADPKSYMFVLEVHGLPVGRVRFELKEERRAEVHYALDEVVRGRGWGGHLLKLGMLELFKQRGLTPFVVTAKVRPDNTPSLALLERLGFKEQPSKEQPAKKQPMGEKNIRTFCLSYNHAKEF